MRWLVGLLLLAGCYRAEWESCVRERAQLIKDRDEARAAMSAQEYALQSLDTMNSTTLTWTMFHGASAFSDCEGRAREMNSKADPRFPMNFYCAKH